MVGLHEVLSSKRLVFANRNFVTTFLKNTLRDIFCQITQGKVSGCKFIESNGLNTHTLLAGSVLIVYHVNILNTLSPGLFTAIRGSQNE